MPHRRTSSLLAAAAATVSLVSAAASLAAAPGAAAAAPIPLPIPVPIPIAFPGQGPVDPAMATDRPARKPTDRLRVTVARSGSPETDGTRELRCHPAGGTHPDARKACAKLDRMTRWGRDMFAPVPQGAKCTMIYGGAATAHVTGTWAGRPVDARFKRTNGCETARWNDFEPLLPRTTS